MACHGGFKLDEATRRSWYTPEEVLSELKKGMMFVDVGCGDGYFSLMAAKKVGPAGTVYAVDIDGARVELLKDKADEEGLENIVAAVGRAEDTVYCEGCADMVFYSMDLHDFDDPQKVLQNAHAMLKPQGRLVDLDWKKMQMEFGPPEHIRFSEEKVAEMLKATGFVVESAKSAGPYHYLIVAKPK
ncbi:MAG TPA: class I SAM-dependent methyltransferase [Candidatus Acidoferrales bacterium]|nr:class I SAM-dependent methyltransferase [Candidatus Acidoferrales bacterium]